MPTDGECLLLARRGSQNHVAGRSAQPPTADIRAPTADYRAPTICLTLGSGTRAGPSRPMPAPTAPLRYSSPSAGSCRSGGGLRRRCRCARPAASTCPRAACAAGRRPPPSNTDATMCPRAAGDGCGERRSAFMSLASGQNPTVEQECPLCPRFLPLYTQLRTWEAPPANVSG